MIYWYSIKIPDKILSMFPEFMAICTYLWFPNQSQAKKSFLSWMWFLDCGVSMEHLHLASPKHFLHNVQIKAHHFSPTSFCTPYLRDWYPPFLSNSQSRNLGIILSSSLLFTTSLSNWSPIPSILTQILYNSAPTPAHLYWYYFSLSTYHFLPPLLLH